MQTNKIFPCILVTVGSTKFENLLKALDTQAIFEIICLLGCKKLIIQKGTGEFYPNNLIKMRFILLLISILIRESYS